MRFTVRKLLLISENRPCRCPTDTNDEYCKSFCPVSSIIAIIKNNSVLIDLQNFYFNKTIDN